MGVLGRGQHTGWIAALPEAEQIGALPLSALILTNLGELALAENKDDEGYGYPLRVALRFPPSRARMAEIFRRRWTR